MSDTEEKPPPLRYKSTLLEVKNKVYASLNDFLMRSSTTGSMLSRSERVDSETSSIGAKKANLKRDMKKMNKIMYRQAREDSKEGQNLEGMAEMLVTPEEHDEHDDGSSSGSSGSSYSFQIASINAKKKSKTIPRNPTPDFLASTRSISGTFKSMNKIKFDRHLLRRLVSQNRKRFIDKSRGFDLDLVYVTPRLIAMAHPSRGLEVLYRNSYTQVMNFFEQTHKNHYRIYNLCMKRMYPLTTHVEQYGFCDHNACPMPKLLQLLKDIKVWLAQDEENVAVVHCKAGKGRTGLVSSCFLLLSEQCATAEEAMEQFGKIRTIDGKGLTVASQRRYVTYYEKVHLSQTNRLQPSVDISSTTKKEMQPISLYKRLLLPRHSSPKFYLSRVEIQHVPGWMKGWRNGLYFKISAGVPQGVIQLSKTNPGDFRLKGEDRHKSRKRGRSLSRVMTNMKELEEETWEWDCANLKQHKKGFTTFLSQSVNPMASRIEDDENPAIHQLQGDIRISCYNDSAVKLSSTKRKMKRLFQLWINTNFIKVKYGDLEIDSYDIDSVWTHAKPKEGFDDIKQGLSATLEFGKTDLDGKSSKDPKHKLFPEDFKVVLHLILDDQPNVRTMNEE